MGTKDKVLVPFRLYKDQYMKIREKAKEDGLPVQKIFEVLMDAYLTSNKELSRLISKRSSERANRKARFDKTERDELLRLIEKEYSPLRDNLGETIKELEEEDEL